MSLATVAPRRSVLNLPIPLILMLLSLAGFVGVGLATGQRSQLSPGGFEGLLERMVGLGFVAIGQTFTILAGSVDLSVANLISVAAVMASFIMQGEPSRMVPAVVLVMGIGIIVGATNGLLVARLKINPLIATLGTGLVLQGLLSATFDNFAGAVPPEFQFFAYGRMFGLPVSVIGLFVLALLAWYALRRTVFGAHVYATGGNSEGARLAGIRTERITLLVHLICSLTASLTGLYLASRLRSGAPWVGRDGIYDLESIAVVVIGGTVLAGGRGGVWGTLAAVLFFATLDAVFNMIGVDAFLKQVLRGSLVIIAVGIYAYRERALVA